MCTYEHDGLKVKEFASVQLISRLSEEDGFQFKGVVSYECYDKHGKLKWKGCENNLVVTVGKNQLLDAALSGSGYTVTGPYMGLISSTSFSAIDATDTMSSHAGWLEAGNANTPTYSGNRKTSVYNSASAGSKSLTAALSFTFTGGGIVKGLFQCFGAGALNTIDNTAGVLFNAVLFSGGDRTVNSGDVLNVSYTVSC